MELLLTLVGLWLLWKLFKLSLHLLFWIAIIAVAAFFADRRHYRLGNFTRLTQF